MTNEMQIFNRQLIKMRRNRCANKRLEHETITNLTADYIIERLTDHGNHYPLALEIGYHSGIVGHKLLAQKIIQQIIYTDISATVMRQIPGNAIIADEEFLPFKTSSFNLITSNMNLHWVNDLPGTLLQIRHSLKENGIFIATLPGTATLCELRQALMQAEIELRGGTAPHISPFADVKTMGHLLQRAGFNKPVADSETIQIAYPDIITLLHDLQNNAENNALIKRSKYLHRNVLKRAAEYYQKTHSNKEGNLLATLEIITITGLA